MSNMYIASCVEEGGIYHYRFDDDLNVKFIDKLTLSMPMYMQFYDDRMYVLLRSSFGKDKSGLVTLDMDKDGFLSESTEPVSTLGEVACHLCTSQKGIYVANYISSNVTKIPDHTRYHQGCGINPQRQTVAHPHYVSVTPDNEYLCVCDLGIDALIVYDFDLNEISRIKVPEGHGIRHLVFSDDGKYAFSANEIRSSVTAFRYEKGRFDYIDTICGLKRENLSSTSAAIRYNNGYIYVSNRGNDTISKISFENERLNLMEEYSTFGKSPRDFMVYNDYIICLNELSDSVTVLYEKDNRVSLVNEINIERPLCVGVW